MEELFRDVIREDLLAEFNRGMEKGLPQEKIDTNIRYLRRQLEEKYGIPFSKAEGGEIYKGVGSLSEVAKNMNNGGVAQSLDAEVEALIPAIIQTESNNDPRAVSEDGAIGLMQVLPETAMLPGYGVPNIFDIAREQGFDVPEESIGMAKKLLFSPDLNVDFGSRYMKAMRRKFDTMEDALRAYNAGPGRVDRILQRAKQTGRDWKTMLPRETQDYLEKFKAK